MLKPYFHVYKNWKLPSSSFVVRISKTTNIIEYMQNMSRNLISLIIDMDPDHLLIVDIG